MLLVGWWNIENCNELSQSKIIQRGDVSQDFERAEDFIKQRIVEIYDRKKISVKCVFSFLNISCAFGVTECC